MFRSGSSILPAVIGQLCALHAGSAILLLLTGCGSPHSSDLQGHVTLDGQPLSDGTITFTGVEGGAIAVARIQSDGSYRLRTGQESGLAAGEYRVTVKTLKRTPTPGMTDVEMNALYITPKHYGDPTTSGLTYDVQPGGNTYDIMLTRSAP